MVKIQLDQDGRRLAVVRTSTGTVMAVQNCPADQRPFAHPILAADGVGSVTEDRPSHHPWQHGLYIGLNDVNGHGFWCEGLLASYKRDGTFHPSPIRLRDVRGAGAAWEFNCVWKGHAGEAVLTETQAWSFYDGGENTWLDLAWTLRASVDVRFGKSAYGGLFLRMPFHEGCEGEVLTSEGVTTTEGAEQQRARWVAASMLIAERGHLGGDARRATVAILDHPSNSEHPLPWRVDNQLGIGPARCIVGEWHLKRGEGVTFRHRVMTHVGRPDAARIEAVFNQFAGSV